MVADTDSVSKGELEMSTGQQTSRREISDENMLQMPEHDVYSRLRDLDWDLHGVETSDFTHGMHSYPAKFIPQIPARLIGTLSNPGELVVDPFSGGGTTGVEALRLRRQFVGLDANPLAVLLGRIKTTKLTSEDRDELTDLLHRAQESLAPGQDPIRAWVPPIPNISKWYSPSVIVPLSCIRQQIETIKSSTAKDLALVAFANTAARVSFQDSESRYVSKPRHIEVDRPAKTFIAELKRIIAIGAALDDGDGSLRTDFKLGDARQPGILDIAPQAAGLIVTSPPYPNAYDYHLYHRFRLFWLGIDPRTLRKVEIGSHLKHQSEHDPAKSYETDMASVLQNLYDILMPGRYCAMVIGDGIYHGKAYETSRHLARLAQELGWIVLPTISRHLPRTRRSVTAAGRRLTTEDILLLRRPTQQSCQVALILSKPNYNRFPYEELLARREVAELLGTEVTEDGDSHSILSDSDELPAEARQLAFWHSMTVPRNGGSEVPTLQRLLENPSAGRRKHSTYVTHGVHRYKGKFYPQLAKALINLSGLPSKGVVVVDPFGGSGTVLLESVINGRDAVSIDCNPLAAAIAQSKIDILDVELGRLCRSSEFLVEQLSSLSIHPDGNYDQFEPSTYEELMSWFAPRILKKLGFLLKHVREVPDPKLVAFYEVLTSDLIREVSQQEPRDLRIRRRQLPVSDAPVVELFCERLRASLSKITAYHNINNNIKPVRGLGHAILGCSAQPSSYATLDVCDRAIDCIVSSPPYATALPYIDTDRLSLAAVYGLNGKRRRAIEGSLIGSRETSKTEMRDLEKRIASGLDVGLPPSTMSFLRELLEAILSDDSAGFRKRQLPTVLLKYFVGVARVIDQLRPRMKEGGHLWFVLGNSRTTIAGNQRIIPTIDEFSAIAVSAGFELIERIPITVTREDLAHSRHSITENTIIHLRAPIL